MPVRSLDFPVTFRVRGTDSSTSATLLQLALGACRIRTWRILSTHESIRIELPLENGEILHVHGKVRTSKHVNSHFEHTIELDDMDCAQQDLLAREAALLVRRRHHAPRLAS